VKRIKPGILIVSILALFVMGWWLFAWISWFSTPSGIRNPDVGPGVLAFLDLVTGIPLALLAGISAITNAAGNRRQGWLIALLLLTVLGVIAVIYSNRSSSDVVSTNTLPPFGLDYAPWLPILIPLATVIYSLWPTPPAQPKPAEPPVSSP
jgi:hypothetical protein